MNREAQRIVKVLDETVERLSLIPCMAPQVLAATDSSTMSSLVSPDVLAALKHHADVQESWAALVGNGQHVRIIFNYQQ